MSFTQKSVVFRGIFGGVKLPVDVRNVYFGLDIGQS